MGRSPDFYWLYTGIIIILQVLIMFPNAPLIIISLWSQVMNGLLLPVVLICMILLVNNKKIMGKYVNKPINNIIGWATIIILIGIICNLCWFLRLHRKRQKLKDFTSILFY